MEKCQKKCNGIYLGENLNWKAHVNVLSDKPWIN